MRCLALDVGDRRVGVAISDPMGLIARPLTVIDRLSLANELETIVCMVRVHQVDCLVVGHPLSLDGSVGPQARRVERFVEALRTVLSEEGTDLPIVLWDESFSTAKAQEAMIRSGRTPKDRRMRIDAVAAAVILQGYLDEKRPSSPPMDDLDSRKVV